MSGEDSYADESTAVEDGGMTGPGAPTPLSALVACFWFPLLSITTY